MNMHVVVSAMRKGGSGKSMLTSNLGVHAQISGDGPVALVDSDPMAGTADWFNARILADEDIRFLAIQQGNLRSALEAAKRVGVNLVFIDTPPAATPAIGEIMKLADLI